MLSRSFYFYFSVSVGAFVIGLSQISSFFSSDKADFLSNTKYDSYKCWTCAELCEVFTFFMENIYVQFEGMVYQQIVGIFIGTN